MKLGKYRLSASPEILLGIAIILSAPVAAASRPTAADIRTEKSLGTEAKVLVQLFREAHYNRSAVTAEDFADIVQEFMASLDGSRMVFLQSDRDTLTQQIGPKLYWNLSTLGDLSGADQIFDVYRARTSERVKWITTQLQGEIALDTGETYVRPGKTISWPADARTADGMWLKRLKAELIDEVLNGRTVEAAKSLLQNRYERWRKSVPETNSRDVADRFLATVAHRYDAHSTYYGPAEFKEFGEAMRADLVGIGLELDTRNGHCFVKDVISGGPADPNHFSVGDEIVAIGEGGEVPRDVSEMTLRQVVGLTRGKTGTSVTLVTQPVDACDPSIRLTTTVSRNRIPPEAIRARARVFQLADEHAAKSALAVVTLSSFYGEITTATGRKASASSDVAELVDKLKGTTIDGLVLDLRGNGGGYLAEAVNLVGLFIGKGPAIQIRDYSGKVAISMTPSQAPRFGGPLVVLVDERSASASEIVAGVLRAYGRAVVVGSQTVGMGSVQTVLELRNLAPALARSAEGSGAARLTIQRVFLPDGASTQLVGVTPDVVLPSAVLVAEHERELLHSLKSESIAACSFGAKPIPKNILELIQMKSAERQSVLPDLIAAKRASDRYVKFHERPVLLNLDERRTQIQSESNLREQLTGLSPEHDNITQSASIDLRQVTERGKSGQTPSGESTGSKSSESDSLLRESLRISRDLIRAGWMP